MLFNILNPDHIFRSFGGVFGVQIASFLVAVLLMRRLDVDGFRRNVRNRFRELI